MTLTAKGELEIDQERGVIYFHGENGITILRICGLPTPVPVGANPTGMLDIKHMYGTNWGLKQ